MKFMRLNRSLLLLTVTVLSFTACKRSHDDPGTEYAPNMYDPVGYEPYKQIDGFKNPFNKYGNNLWEPVRGTVSRPNYHTKFTDSTGRATEDLMVYNIHPDSITISERVLKNPIPLNEKTLTEGKEYYARYCQHCHGETGKGDGLVAKQYKGVPVYSGLPPMNDGHIFHVITHGKGRMWPHGSQMTPEERWKIVHYVQQLQKS